MGFSVCGDASGEKPVDRLLQGVRERLMYLTGESGFERSRERLVLRRGT